MSGYARLKLLLGESTSAVLVLGVASFISALAEAGILTIAAQVATSLVDGHHHVRLHAGPVHLHTTVATLLLVALVIAIIRLLLQGITSYYPALIAGEVQATMRRDLFGAFTVAAWELQSEDREGHFQEVMTNQIMQASQGALQATTLIVTAFTFVILVVSAFALNVVAAAAVLVAATALFVALRPLNSLGQRLSRGLSAAQMEYAGGVSEGNTIAEETQVFGVAALQREKVDRLIATSKDLFVRSQFLGRGVANVYQSVIYIILVVGLIAVNGEHVASFSALGAVVLLLVRAGSYGQQVQGSYVLVRQSLPFVERIQEATARYKASQPVAGEKQLERVRTLTFEGVGYSYVADRPVLKAISYEVSGGETIGVVGPSGAGKSTMVQLLLRLRSPQEGTYSINGTSVEEYEREDWNRRVLYVPQQPRLIFASVADNVRFFRQIDDEAVEYACRLARIHDEIMSWPQGYDTIVGPRAAAVSGGQQQRICLARAIAGEPEVLVLDEPTSALDPRSETLIQESLIGLKQQLTLFLIAHRMSTLTICDRVMVVVDGRLEAFDTLEALRHSNHYFQLASSLAGSAVPGPTAAPAETTAATDTAPRSARARNRPK
jgi:ATP-binding cassette subfamily B protein